MKEIIADMLTTKPIWGIVASITGFAGSILTFMHVLTIFVGFLGAIFGTAAGFYTFLLQRRAWRNRHNKKHHPARYTIT